MSATIRGDAVARDTGRSRRDGGSAPRKRWRVPVPPLIALAGVTLVGLIGLMPGQPDDGAKPIAQRTLQVIEGADHSLAFRNVADGSIVARAPGTGMSFVRGVFHSLIGYRRLHGVSQDQPYMLAELSDGRVVLTDKLTSTKIELEGFGSTNASKFTAMLGLPPVQAPE